MGRAGKLDAWARHDTFWNSFSWNRTESHTFRVSKRGRSLKMVSKHQTSRRPTQDYKGRQYKKGTNKTRECLDLGELIFDTNDKLNSRLWRSDEARKRLDFCRTGYNMKNPVTSCPWKRHHGGSWQSKKWQKQRESEVQVMFDLVCTRAESPTVGQTRRIAFFRTKRDQDDIQPTGSHRKVPSNPCIQKEPTSTRYTKWLIT